MTHHARDPRAIAVVGATATGKTDLAEALAQDLDAEIVCCDSRQVFRELEIGTGKPSPAARAARPHHLFDALELGQRASAGWFARAAHDTRASIRARGRVPLLVGGSGLYLKAAMQGLAAEPPHDPLLRARLARSMEQEGPEALHRQLREVDPATAARLAPRDRQRIARALEVAMASGRPLSWWHAQEAASRDAELWVVVELVLEPALLRERIASRTRTMFDQGLVEEATRLVEAGRGPALRALRAIGYDEALALAAGALTREEAERRVDRRTAQLAKRQRTWFRHQVRAIRLDGALPEGELRASAGAAVSDVGSRR